MKRPRNLDETAKEFWDRHAKRLKEQGLLTDATFDSFALLCKTYSLLARMDPETEKNGMIKYIALSKLFQTYTRGFGMNTDKPKQSQPTVETDEYGL